MATQGEKVYEPFSESVETIAERVRINREEEDTDSVDINVIERQSEEVEQIKNELLEAYAAENDLDISAPVESSETAPATYLDEVDEEYKVVVGDLVQTAVTENIVSAITRAQAKNDPYLMDSFHDALALFLHQKMKEQDLL